MAKTVNNVKINATFTTAASREQLTSGENLCTSLGKVNKYLVDLDAGAFSFPANGGNADTLDGFHETSFPRNREDISDCNNAVLPGTYNATPETVNTPYAAYWLISVETGSNGAWIRQTATISDITKPNEIYCRLFINDKWSDSWVKVNDGGNADTLDSKHATDFSQIINLGNTSTDTKTATGIPYKTTIYWCAYWTDYPAGLTDGQGVMIAVNYKSTSDGNTCCRQFYISPTASAKIYQRAISGTSVGDWKNIADGGTAASVGTYTEAKIAALEARIAALEGK